MSFRGPGLIANQIILFIFARAIYDAVNAIAMVIVMLYRRPYNNCTFVSQLCFTIIVILERSKLTRKLTPGVHEWTQYKLSTATN